VSVEEELKLLKYYASKIQGICQVLHFPAKVRATALLYLKRAYLAFSSLDHNPKNIMLACIYLAGKVGRSPGVVGEGGRDTGELPFSLCAKIKQEGWSVPARGCGCWLLIVREKERCTSGTTILCGCTPATLG